MKITKTASGTKKITMSKNEWQQIGRQAGWADNKLSKKAESGDNVIAESFSGEVNVSGKARGTELNNNFLIISDNGDWSGFMPLQNALAKLDQLAKRSPDKYFAVVER